MSTWDGTQYSVTGVERFVYDGWNLVAVLDGNNALLRTYVWGIDLSGSEQGAGGVGGLLAEVNSSGTYIPYYDGNGNVTAYVDSNGAKVASYDYDPFGKIVKAEGLKANDFSYRFSTKFFDNETGLYYYGYRFYAADYGRWLTRDPIQEKGGYNLYGMCGNNPLKYYDYLGHLFDFLLDLRDQTSNTPVVGPINSAVYGGAWAVFNFPNAISTALTDSQAGERLMGVGNALRSTVTLGTSNLVDNAFNPNFYDDHPDAAEGYNAAQAGIYTFLAFDLLNSLARPLANRPVRCPTAGTTAYEGINGNSSYATYTDENGNQRIIFNANDALTGYEAMPGRNMSNEARAGITSA